MQKSPSYPTILNL